MGCSPSRGNNFSGTHGPFRRGKTLLPTTKESPGDSQSDDGGSGSAGGGETDGEACEKAAIEKKGSHCGGTNSVSAGKKQLVAEPAVATITSDKLGTQEITINLLAQKTKEKQDEKQDDKKGTKKSKKGPKSEKPSKKKEKGKKSAVEEKVDFPEPLVKAHQAAYGYLNPSIAKCEILLSLLDHAAQTQISLQPMVAFMVLRYEEINKGLEEMVEEGEQLLKENGEHLAWPCNMKNLSSSSSIKSRPPSTEPPPDLLQQLLQYTVQRMRLVGQSVSGIGDTALEEAVEYFSSVSEVLEEKLKAKRGAEARLMQLLTRIEASSIRRPGPEDSALFSEDSGIGVESESLAGSDRQRHRRESCESTASNRTILFSSGSSTPVNRGSSKQLLTRKMRKSSSQNSIDSTCTIVGAGFRDTESLLGSASLDDGEEEEDEDEEEEEKGKASEDDHCKGKTTKRSSSSPPDHQPCRLPAKRIENPQNVEMTLKMKDAISGRIHFVSSQHSGMRTKAGTSKTGDRQWTEEGEKSPNRPQTAASRAPKKKTAVPKQCRSKSAESLRSKAEDPTLIELQRTQKELSQRLEKIRKVRFDGNIRKNISKPLQAQETQTGSIPTPGPLHPLNKSHASPNSQRKTTNTKKVMGNQEDLKGKEEEKKKKDKTVKGPLKATPPPSPPPSPRQPLGMRGNSVKKLIDTFTQGMEDSRHIESTKVLGPLKGVRKCGVPIIPGLGGADIISYNGNSNMNQGESRTSERIDDLDLDNLPPPPPEVLMDNSFENVDFSKTDESIPRRGRSTLPKKTNMSQRLRASVQSVAVLPSKGTVRRSSLSMSPARTVPQDPNKGVKNSQLDSKPEADLENDEAASLYKQARKIIHLRHSTDSPTEKNTGEISSIKSCVSQSNVDRQEGGKSTPETVPSTPVAESQPPATPPVSRTRMLPSTPVLHRKLPSPPVFKKQSVYPSSSSPPVIRKLPTPPPTGHRTLPSTPASRQQVTPSSTSSVSAVTFPFKAPSPPASPKVQRWARENNNEESTSRVFSNIRSVFCPASPSLFEAQPFPVPKPPQAWTSSGSSILPRPWGERARLPVSVRGPQPFIRRSQSDRRPSLSFPPRAPVVSVAQTCGSEPAISTQGCDSDSDSDSDDITSIDARSHSRLEDGPSGEVEAWSEQTELRGASRSASHPDLCIVGQALQRE